MALYKSTFTFTSLPLLSVSQSFCQAQRSQLHSPQMLTAELEHYLRFQTHHFIAYHAVAYAITEH